MARWADYGMRKLEGTGRPLPPVSFPLSLAYEALLRARNRCYDKGFFRIDRLSLPVVSVGNLTLGGTGKTPVVIMLAGLLRRRGYRPAVISRGYGGRSPKIATIVSDGRDIKATVEEAGDEPVLIATSLEGVPVLTGRRRFMAGKAALAGFDVDILILDDAFQHRSLYRDVDIVLVDGDRPFGNGRIFPGGTLREPPGGIRRAHLVLVTDGPPHLDTSDIEEIAPGIPLFRAQRKAKDLLDCATGTSEPLASLRGKRVAAFAGIAVPKRFHATLAPFCGSIEPFLAFPDHHPYNGGDRSAILAAAASADIIVTTEKDGVRLRRYPDFYRKLKLLRIEMSLSAPPDELMNVLHGYCGL